MGAIENAACVSRVGIIALINHAAPSGRHGYMLLRVSTCMYFQMYGGHKTILESHVNTRRIMHHGLKCIAISIQCLEVVE
jgi:hypothetical protein